MTKYKLVPADLIDRFPEINPRDYGHYDVCDLIGWGVELVHAAVDAPALQGEPVAYLFPDEVGRTRFVLGKETAEHLCPLGESITPLYAAPTVQEEMDEPLYERKLKNPLTKAERDHLLHALSCIESDLPEHWSVMGKLNEKPAPDVEVLVEALEGLLGVIGESRGGSGYHLNGEIAEWDEFQEVYDAAAALDTYYKRGEL